MSVAEALEPDRSPRCLKHLGIVVRHGDIEGDAVEVRRLRAARLPDCAAPPASKWWAARKVVGALLTKGLVEEVEAGCDAPVWRHTGDANGATFVAIDAALEFLGIDAASGPTAASTDGASVRPALSMSRRGPAAASE